MWPYKQINRKDFETIKEKVEKYMVFLGAEKQIVDVPYEQTTTSYVRNQKVTTNSSRAVYKFRSDYYRVDEVCFAEKPFIVFEFGSYEDVLANTMEDVLPFPFDLSDDEIFKMVAEVMMIDDIDEYLAK